VPGNEGARLTGLHGGGTFGNIAIPFERMTGTFHDGNVLPRQPAEITRGPSE
jgi:hypothetical protein